MSINRILLCIMYDFDSVVWPVSWLFYNKYVYAENER